MTLLFLKERCILEIQENVFLVTLHKSCQAAKSGLHLRTVKACTLNAH